MADPILSVRGLNVTFAGTGSPVPAVRGVDFDVWPNEVLGIVGESGSGKSVTALALSGLLPPNARIAGSVRLGQPGDTPTGGGRDAETGAGCARAVR